MEISRASERAQEYSNEKGKWFCGFAYNEVRGLGYEKGIHRRDPSNIILVGEKYYVWYTKSVGPYNTLKNGDVYGKTSPKDYAEIYYATSMDAINWVEEGCAITRGESGAYDERTVCTPNILVCEDMYYLVYQTMQQGEFSGTNMCISMAKSTSPTGPFVKMKEPILVPTNYTGLFQDTPVDNYNSGIFTGVAQEPCLICYKERYYLYYKCAIQQDNVKCAGIDSRWGVAIADAIEGPYTPCEYNPITNSGSETLLWKYQNGIVALLNRDGPEKDTIQYAEDGVEFDIMSHLDNTPLGGGVFQAEDIVWSPLAGLQWGLCHCNEQMSTWNYLMRFDIDRRSKPYKIPTCYAYNV